MDLASSISVIPKMMQAESPIPSTRLAIILGTTVSSSTFAKKTSALKAYGLIEEEPKNTYTVSERGKAVAFPKSPQTAADARKQAFLSIGVFSHLFEQHKGKLLPADEFLRNIVEQERKIPRDYSEAWVSQFKEGARTAGLFYDRGDGKIQISESPIIPNGGSPVAQPLPDSEPPKPATPPIEMPRLQHGDQHSIPMDNSGHTTKIRMSNGQIAQFLIPDRLTSNDAAKLKRALEGLAVLLDSMVVQQEVD